MPLFHFDLRHLSDASDLRVSVLGDIYDLTPHTESTLATARREHLALAALPPEAHKVFTHSAHVDDAHFADERIRWVRVVRPAPPGVHLPEVALMSLYLPEGHLRAFYQHRFGLRKKSLSHLRAFYRPGMKAHHRLHSAKLAMLGMESLPEDEGDATNVLVQAQTLMTPGDTAGALIAHHPELANVQPYTATIVYHDHIMPDPDVDPDQYNAMNVLSNAIAHSKVQPWSPVIPCRDQKGNPLKAGYELDGIKENDQLNTYGLSDPVSQVITAPTSGARRTASNDMRLANKTWTPNAGTTALVRSGDAPTNKPFVSFADVTAEGPFKWTVNEQTSHHGVSVDKDSITIDGSNNFSINASNSYLRTLYVGYRLFDDGNQPIGDTQQLQSITAVNTLMGIPMPTDPTQLSFNIGNAHSVELYFGSLGTSDWNSDVSVNGALLTGLWQYGIPVVFLIAGKAITSTSAFNKIVSDKELVLSAIAIAFPIVGGGVATAAALANTKTVLISFGDVVLSIVLQKGMEKLGTWLVEQAGKGAIANAFGPVGWVMRLAATALDFEEMAVTTGEVLSSPACITVKVSRAIDVSLTLHPDPRHGEAGHPETAVWPALGQQYVVTLQYKDGTNFQLKGQLPATTSNEPLPLTFADVPAGGQFRIIAGIYSNSGWLAGYWQCDWTNAVANQGTTLALGDQTITENLVPLAPDTQYVFKEKVAYQGDDFVWQASAAPSDVRTALDCGGDGTVCELVNMTINNSAFQVGYAWRASKQNLHPDMPSNPPSNDQLYAVQNLSMLTDPGSHLITTSIGFTNRPAIAYAPSTNTQNVIDQTNFVLDPRGGGMNLRQVELDAGNDFGLGNSGLQSWGSFPLQNVDALAIHPSSAVIACSYQQHKLMILNLPSASAPDGEAPVALMVSGEGVREGLMQGPNALAVAPDGRILVLESLGKRVQAFDTKGNPVPSFTPHPALFTLTTSEVAGDLDAGRVPEAFQAGLQSANVYLFTLDNSFTAQLNSAAFQPENDHLIQALSQQGVILAYDPDAMGDPTQSAQIKVVQAGQSWIITDPRGEEWQVLNQSDSLAVYPRVASVEVRAEKPGAQWLLLDKQGGAWKLTPSSGSPGQTEVKYCSSFFPLRQPRVSTVTFDDMAVESQGYIYVLSHLNDGSQPTDYLLDIYGPDGTFLVRNPDPSATRSPQNILAGRIAVDIWRNLYGLTFETLQGPNGAPQPGLAHWMPTPPLFTIPLSEQANFNQQNIGAVVQDFAAHDITLSNNAFITVTDPDGVWQVKDGETIYYVYRSGDGLQVYAIPA